MSIMSDEEKKAIKTLKEVASDDFDTLGDDISPKMAQNILNVIEKQQKEIGEYKEAISIIKTKPLSVKLKDKKGNVIAEMHDPLGYISKDKIREKIKELEAMSVSQDIYYDDIKEMFEELLEEN